MRLFLADKIGTGVLGAEDPFRPEGTDGGRWASYRYTDDLLIVARDDIITAPPGTIDLGDDIDNLWLGSGVASTTLANKLGIDVADLAGQTLGAVLLDRRHPSRPPIIGRTERRGGFEFKRQLIQLNDHVLINRLSPVILAASDDFTYGDGSLAGNSSWAKITDFANLQVVSNLLNVAGTSAVGTNYFNSVLGDPDHWMRADFTLGEADPTDTSNFVFVRHPTGTATTWYRMGYNFGGGVAIREENGGTETTVASDAAYNPTSGAHSIIGAANGTSLYLFEDDVQLLTGTDSTLTTGEMVGLHMYDESSTTQHSIDNADWGLLPLNLTVTVKKTGGDYSTVQSALDAANVNLGYWKIEVSDDELYQEVLDIDTVVGTPSLTNYIWLTAAVANRHSGDGTVSTHARIESPSTGSGHIITVDKEYCRISWLDLRQDSNASSDEGIRINDSTANHLVVSHCLIHGTDRQADQDGIYFGNGGTSGTPIEVSIDNCSIYNWERAGIHPQNWTGESHSIWNIDHCSLAWNGKHAASVEVESAAIYVASGVAAQSTHVMNIYNTAMGETESNAAPVRDIGDGDTSARGAPTGTVTWNGSHNLTAYANVTPLGDIDGTDNTTNWQFADDGVAAVTKSADNWWVIKDATYSLTLADLRLLNNTDAGNIALTNGTDRQGSEPDSRQDFSTDGTGAARPTSNVDIGFDQVSDAAPYVNRLSARVVDHGSPDGSGDFTSAGFTTDADSLLVAVVNMDSQNFSVLPSLDWPTPVTSGTTWVKKKEAEIDQANTAASAIYMADSPGSGSGRTFAMNSANSRWDANVNAIDVVILEFPGFAAEATQPGTSAIFEDPSASGRNPGAETLTLPAAPATTSYVVAAVAKDTDTDGGATPASGWIEELDIDASTGPWLSSQVMSRTGSASTSVTWDRVNTIDAANVWDMVQIAVEVLETAATTGATPFTSGYSRNHRHFLVR